MMKNILNTLFILCITSFSYAQLKKKVLFIGNSYTYVNNLPQMLADLSLSLGDTLVYDSNTPGGYTFQNHSTNAVTLAKIKSQQWDVVVLQAQSQEPSFPPAQVTSDTYPYAKILVDSIRKNNPCTNIMFYMTWGRQNGDASNCSFYAPLCTYTGMQARLRESYMQFKDSFLTSVAPVGVAWKTFRLLNPSINLYQSDESHPSLSGSYLTACVFYSSIFQKTTIGSNYTTGLPSSDIFAMQTIGSNTVLDSISNWNLNSTSVLANFSYTNTSGNAFQFFNTSINASNYLWSFGSTQSSPSFTFTGSGPYSIKLVASNGCKTDSTEIQVSSSTLVRNYNKIDLGITLFPNPTENIVSIKCKYSIYSTKIINQMGEVVLFQNNIKKGTTTDIYLKDLPQGIYFIIIETSRGLSKQKVIKI